MIDAIIHHIQLNGLLGFIGGYAIGGIPFGLLLCFLAGYGDIRKIGSGNIGATNVLRTGNKPLALMTLILDSSKGALAALFMGYAGGVHAMFGAALGSVLGHNFPVCLKFKGGKGVATTLGVFLALNWMTGLACCTTWLVVALARKISSLAALAALAMAPIFAVTIGNPKQVYLIGLISLIGWIRHKDNITRLLAGTEPKIGKKKAEPEVPA